MHIIRVYAKCGGLVATFKGIDAERQMREAGFNDQEFNILR